MSELVQKAPKQWCTQGNAVITLQQRQNQKSLPSVAVQALWILRSWLWAHSRGTSPFAFSLSTLLLRCLLDQFRYYLKADTYLANLRLFFYLSERHVSLARQTLSIFMAAPIGYNHWKRSAMWKGKGETKPTVCKHKQKQMQLFEQRSPTDKNSWHVHGLGREKIACETIDFIIMAIDGTSEVCIIEVPL